MLDRDRFFAAARSRAFAGSMTQGQVDGCNAILDGWQSRPNLSDRRWLAYMLATAKWETAHTMQPIEEWGRGKGRPYGVPVNGKVYYGRGYVQLTWAANYARMAALVGVDLVNQPELALNPLIAAAIMFEGMVAGLFTGVGLPKYFNGSTDDPVNARRIINGTDHAEDIAQIHHAFLAGLQLSAPALSRGDQGRDVSALQAALKQAGWYEGAIDGDFGPVTQAAVRSFQAMKGMYVDGIASPATMHALGLA